MPASIVLSDKPLSLSPEFTYEVGPGSDAVYVAAFQGAHPLTDEQTLKPGDKLDSRDTLTAFTLGDAVLLQYGHEETDPHTSHRPSKADMQGDQEAYKDNRSEEPQPPPGIGALDDPDREEKKEEEKKPAAKKPAAKAEKGK